MKGKTAILLLVFMLSFVGPANSTLWDRGGGLIYDDVLDVTWLQDANYAATSGYSTNGGLMTFSEASDWAANLAYYDSIRDVHWNDWRLPDVLPVDGTSFNYSLEYDGSTDIGYNISASNSLYEGTPASEMAYMYYVNLRNISYYALDYPISSEPQTGWTNWPNTNFVDGLGNEVSFENLIANWYWSGTPAYNPYDVFTFRFDYGGQNHSPAHPYHFAWAVRDGDVGPAPVPEPSTIFLLSTGLICIAGISRKKLKV